MIRIKKYVCADRTMKHDAFLLLGTNLGDRKRNLTIARNTIEVAIGPIIQASATYETEAWGKVDQPHFLNQAIAVQTDFEPLPLLQGLLQIEKQMGRERVVKWGERLIDIDILLYDKLDVHTPDLIIPHHELANRRFALVPLAEIAANVLHPGHHVTIRELLERCPDKLTVKLVK